MTQPPDFAEARRGLLLGLALLLALTLFAACDNGDDRDMKPTASEPETTAQEATPTPDESLELPTEMGEAPIYWRTQDRFQSLQADEPYKVVVRLTSGYDEETLRIVAEQKPGRSGTVEFEARRAEPVSLEDPSSYYPFNLELPQPGTWVLTALAGDDQVSITVEVKPAAG